VLQSAVTMATAACVPGGGLSRADLLSEIQTRLELTESEVERMRLRFRRLHRTTLSAERCFASSRLPLRSPVSSSRF
jgi:hypothetical protein